MISKIKKIYRFIQLYGWNRTMTKMASRTHKVLLKYFITTMYKRKKRGYISLIGCGQFGFSTISYYVQALQGKIFLNCYDTQPKRSILTANFFGYQPVESVEELIVNPHCRVIYIASNHHSHTTYAIKGLENNKDVYLEKPISVSKEQLNDLKTAVNQSQNNIYAGYNRPYSKSIRKTVSFIENNLKPISLNCFISGHVIDESHWYRNPEEGTRICGNVGHWIDLMVHLMNKRGKIPNRFDITITNADPTEIDDNINISIRTNYGDIISIFITSRTEPFEGINETINLQCGDVIVKIDDFKRITIWKNDFKIKRTYFRKDVGHKLAINQPFLKNEQLRDWSEIETSTLLMLEVMELVKNNISHKTIEI